MTTACGVRRALAVAATMLTASGCAFQGVNYLPLPGVAGRGPGAAVYHVQMANVGTLESNSPVMINDVTVGSVGPMTLHGTVVDVEMSIKHGVTLPANTVATIGQTSLLGSMHLELAPPPGQPATGTLRPGAVIPAGRTGSYPSTEQTLSSLAAVVTGGGLGQIGAVVHNLNEALSGHQSDARDLLARLDTFVTTLNDQRDNIVATIDELNRFADIVGGQHDSITRALRHIPPALDVLLTERPRLTTALDKLRIFSDAVTATVHDTQANLEKNLANLAPALQSLADVGPDLDTALAYAPVFPYGQNLIDRGVRGDYFNFYVTLDITRPKMERTLFAGTRWERPRAEEIPAPGDPGYEDYYTRNPMGTGIGGPLGPVPLVPPPPWSTTGGPPIKAPPAQAAPPLAAPALPPPGTPVVSGAPTAPTDPIAPLDHPGP
jgi:phospholipid/cholesterol/gamma-HCH transport system substrate-binding protein